MWTRLCLVSSVLLFSAPVRAEDLPTEPAWVWAEETSSHVGVPLSELTDREAELQAHCGTAELGLRAVATRLVARKIRGLPYLDLDGLTFAQRAAGEPHVWPRAWIVSGRALDHASTLHRLDAWRASFKDIGQRRCGIAAGYAADGSEVVAAVALDAPADLAAVPVRVRGGSWVTVDATVLVSASSAEVVVMGPSGDPRPVPSSFDGTHVRARFSADRPGAFFVQVVVDAGRGPRPALEANVFADIDPPRATPNLAAPGEDATAAGTTKSAALFAMVSSMRTFERLPALEHSAVLDGIAAAHALRMKQAGTVAHDVGDGDPATRVANAGVNARETGENVAHAQSVALAHRALYASISHRENLVRADYTHVGVAVMDDPDGSVWVAEVFSTAPR